MLTDIIPSHTIATLLLKYIDSLLDAIGLEHQQTIEEILYVAIIVVLSLGLGWVVKKGILFVTQKAVAMRRSVMGRELLQQRVLTKCSHIIPPLVFMGLIPFAFVNDSQTLDVIMRLAGVYTLICFGIGLISVLKFIFFRVNERENNRNLPLKGILNIAIGLVWIIIAIVAVSIIINKSPGSLLAGLGAFAAALMLIFKDSILGFVAGIQMSENDMVHVGDWITVPGTLADGTVEDVTLSTVKIRNFDNTLVTVPPYTLVEKSFQNWRGMAETGVRRICPDVIIDLTTIVPCDDALIQQVLKIHPELTDFVANANKAPDRTISLANERPLNGSTLTNLGLFRAYVSMWLMNNPMIAKDQRIMIRLKEPTTYGVPMNIWCFACTTNFDEYEGIYSGVLEHVIMSAEQFGLGIYSSSSLIVDANPPAHEAAPAPATVPDEGPRQAPQPQPDIKGSSNPGAPSKQA